MSKTAQKEPAIASHNRKEKASVLFLTQYFYPEVASTAQLMTDLTTELHKAGHEVGVFTGQPFYWDKTRLPPRETYQGVAIRRFANPGLSKRRALGRMINMGTVALLAAARLAFARKPDVVVADTTSPFFPFVACLVHLFWRRSFIFLVEDVYPDVAIRLGYMRPNGTAARVWNRLNRWVYRSADRIVALGPRMREIILSKLPDGVDPEKVVVIHNWADGDAITPRDKAENWFCRKHGLTQGLVVLYSGNLGESHDLETLVHAADRLRDIPTIRFVLIGDGGKRDKLAAMVKDLSLDNLLMLPYQPRENLPYSLTCGDIAVVTLEPGVEGLCVPSKLYSSLAAGQAIVAILGEGSEVSDIVAQNQCGFRSSPGDVDTLVDTILRLHDNPDLLQDMKQRARTCFDASFTRPRALEAYMKVLGQATHHARVNQG